MDPLQLLELLTASLSIDGLSKESNDDSALIGPALKHTSCLHPVTALPITYQIDHTNTMTAPARCFECSVDVAREKTIDISKYWAPFLEHADIKCHPERHVAMQKIEFRRKEEILAVWRGFGETWTGVERASGHGREVLNMYLSSPDGIEMKLILRWQTREGVCMITSEQEVIDLV